ncbi:MAG TPA: TetR-like C-terminal domain-containing protein, partial [Thermoanaerobaculia bacterium]|nr:TetR-like C-terminal domain-containing protein [Thermoanaerobaculia bacterium]
RRIGNAYVDFGLKHPNQYRFMFMTPRPPLPPEMSSLERGNPEQDAYAFLKGTVEQGIAQGRFRRELDDPELVSQVVWEATHGAISLQIAKCNDGWIDWRPVPQSAALVIDALIRGLTRKGE